MTLTRSGSTSRNRAVVRQAPATVIAAFSAYFALSRKARSLGLARSSGAIAPMRRSRSAPALGSPPVSVAISLSESPAPRLKKKGALMPPCPWRRGQTRSERGPATEAEELLPIVRLFHERHGKVETDGSERRCPQDAGADRCTHMHRVVDRARRCRADRARDDLPGRSRPRQPAGRAFVVP